MKKIYAAFLFLFSLSFFSAELKAQVTGQIVDSTNLAVPFCNIMLVNASDSSVVTGTTADANGNFNLEKKSNGEFRLLVRFTGYTPFYTSSFVLSDEKPKYEAGKIVLYSDARLMKDLVITADKPFMEQQIDRTVYNIENSVIASGSNAFELLRKLPGVTVDNSDNIQVRGKPGVQIMIDGRKSSLSGQDIASYLRTIDASQIQKIEVITNPSSKYDAAGNAIINIVLKKNQQLGLNGQVTGNYNQGFYGGWNGNLNANYRLKKINFFGNYSHGDGRFYDSSKRTTLFGDSNSPSERFESRQRFVNHSIWNYARFGVDLMPNEKHTIGIVVEGSNSDNKQSREYGMEMYGTGTAADSSLYTSGQQRNLAEWRSYNLNYQFKIDTTGKQFDMSISYAPFSIVTTRDNTTNFFDANNTSSGDPALQKLRFPSSVNIFAAQADYTLPIGKKIKFETGLKNSSVDTDNEGQYRNVINGQDITDTLLSNHFVYTEHIYAAYVNYAQQLNSKIEFQIGLRGEQTQSKGTLLTNNSSFSRQYFNLFPSAFFNWKIDSTHTLNISYSRRIDRPDYGDLNPFIFYTSPLSYYTGNPYMLPQLSNSYEISHVYKETFTISAGFLQMKNVFALIPHVIDSSNVFYTQNGNFGSYKCWNILGSVVLPVASWYTTVSSVNIFYDDYSSMVAGSNFNSRGLTWQLSTLNMFTINKNLSAELSFFYRSLNRNTVWREAQLAGLDMGLRYKIADGKGNISLSFSDILWRTYINGTAEYEGMKVITSGRNDSRRLYLSVSWKFGRSQYQREEKRNGGSDVIERAK